MQDKNKVTLYLPPDLHRQLKIRSAVEAEPMSAIAERALVFYLTHPAIVDEVEISHGGIHQIYSCPSCTTSLVLREGDLVSLGEQPGILADDEITKARVQGEHPSALQGEQELVPC